MTNVESWERAASRYQEEYAPQADAVPYGPGLPNDAQLHLLPAVSGKRVLDLGCGAGQAAVAFARQGARMIAVDSSQEQLAAARRLAEDTGAKIDFHLGDLTELAFVKAESIDLVFCASTLDYVEDLGRVLRAVHRVLEPHGAFVFTLDHPFTSCLEGSRAAQPVVARPYGDPAPIKVDRYGELFLLYPRTVADIIGSLTRAGFRVEALAEPTRSGAPTPAGTVWRARKDGR